jgi:hypothetical protein
MSEGDEAARLIEQGDLDQLTRHVDRLCDRADWPGLVDLRDRCRAALARGKQLWPVATNAEYRLALEAPGQWAASVLDSQAGRFARGPLPEVAASTHTWSDLAPHVPATPAAAVAAHERVVRGEVLRDDAVAARLPAVLELPMALEPWEPRYALAEYHADRVELPRPPFPPYESPAGRPNRRFAGRGREHHSVKASERLDDDEATRALTELAAAWTAESNGRAEAVAVRGKAAEAVGALGPPAAQLEEVGPQEALAVMAWTAASGGAHGRRRGAAAGRFATWWALAALGGLVEEWPVSAEELGEVAAELRWYGWDAGEPESGWVLRLAVEDPAEGLAWALAAVDST